MFVKLHLSTGKKRADKFLCFFLLLFLSGAGFAAPYWGEFKKDECTSSKLGLRQYSSILHEIPAGSSWESACEIADANVAGVYFEQPTRCVNSGFNMWGEFDVPDNSCAAYWAANVGTETHTAQDDGCVSDGAFAGKRKFASRLFNIAGESWEAACARMPMTLAGKRYEQPHHCVNRNGAGMWGEWFIPDSRCEANPAPYVRGAEDALASTEPLSGFVDMHTHLMSHLGFGGIIFHGQPYGNPATALAHCPSGNDEEHAEGHSRVEAILQDGIDDILAAALGTARHEFAGYPNLPFWPAHNSLTHQTMYYDWIERAYKGGLRTMVVLAVNGDYMFGATDNGLPDIVKGISIADNPIYDLDDMATLRRQTQAVFAMEAWVDEKFGGPGKGWFRVVKSAEDAQAIVAAGKLAVILGSEVDYLLGCTPEQCTDGMVEAGIEEIYNLGIRYAFPIHLKTNGFGGAALYNILTGGESYDCQAFGQDCNQLGLTDMGAKVMEAMMEKGMIIDVGHMSARALEGALTLAEEHQYPGIVTGHSGAYDMANGGNRHEANPPGYQLQRILNLGGMVGLIPGQGNLNNVSEWRNNDGSYIAHGCGGTSQTFAQTYQYLYNLSGDLAKQGRIAVGTDFNGFAHEPGPRFGSHACEGGMADNYTQPESSKVRYPFAPDPKIIPPAIADSATLFESPYEFGNRIFDFNTEGLSHIGLMPEFFEDLRQQGLKRSELEPVYRSAGYFATMWKNAQAWESQ
ncbi:membrane dipeptidase [Teredinibacter turnerae]|uniref:membrane dipeptidase n=1 Tax=Teredinibacter turnerae TaxID=2426 RepID=UPI0009E5AFF2|nr:membrane dipeptidase [Teredinibacter turnerae]